MAHFAMPASDLARTIEDFLHASPHAVVVEDGQLIFDLETARYSITLAHDKCVLEMWSEERNHVRRVEQAEIKNGVLRLAVRKFGQPRPHKLEICSERDRRTPAAKKAERGTYQRLLERALRQHFPDFRLEKGRLTSATDLEHSFGPAYVRGLLTKGQSAWAVLGAGSGETGATCDGALAIGLLWLEHCREQFERGAVSGLLLILPPGRTETVRARAARLRTRPRVFELDERDEALAECDVADGGNIATRLVQAPNEANVRERFVEAIAQVTAIVPRAEVVVVSSGEVSFRFHGLEFARARAATDGFAHGQEISFGAGRFATRLTADNEDAFRALMQRVMETRHAAGPRHDALWRMQAERWLEALVVADVTVIDPQLDAGCVYSQVPAFAASDRAMIDVLTCTRGGRLAVIELKAEEDLQLPMQGLDYWARVDFHQQRKEFQKFGYFPGRQLTEEAPLLYLVAPALRVHPSTDALLRALGAKIEWTFVGVNEDWRHGVRVIFRKRNQGTTKETKG